MTEANAERPTKKAKMMKNPFINIIVNELLFKMSFIFHCPYNAIHSKLYSQHVLNLYQIFLVDENGLNDTNSEIVTNINALKEDLTRLRESQIRSSSLRSQAQKYCDFEKPTKYFCNLEKRNSINKVINRVTIKDKTITDPQKILQELKSFYKNLLTTKHSANEIGRQFLNENITKKLSDENKKECEGLIKVAEVKDVLKNMENGKSPGTDGFTAEFYKFFWNDIGVFVVNSINDSFTEGELSITQKQGLISLIPKGNKPRDLIKNWRPITLLNIDYKLLAGALANRLKKVLLNLIQNEQKGFLKNRYIGENIRTISDIIHYINEQNLTGMILLISKKHLIRWNGDIWKKSLRHTILEMIS